MSFAGLRVRPMRPADLARVIALAESLMEAPHWTPAAWLTALDAQSTPRRIALVAAEEKSGAIRGFLVASLLPPQAELETIVVAEGARRLGVGRRLFAETVMEMKLAGVQEVWLEVRASNRPARGFYRALGFAETGWRTGYYADPIEDAVLMGMRLSEPPAEGGSESR
ncbi:MAG: GNAT family N-acetyltransferase [Acidobacteriota bacterium]|nr:GNAT family N-acetyltransferase [Acidobacteriota bacterium]